MHLADELHITKHLEMPAKGPDHQRRSVLLDGKTRLAVLEPWVPTARQRAGGVVLVQEVAIGLDDLAAEAEETA